VTAPISPAITNTTLSIVGFDNLELSALFSPGLTTVTFSTSQIGDRVAEKLLMTLAGTPAPDAIYIQTNLVVRGSLWPRRANTTPMDQ